MQKNKNKLFTILIVLIALFAITSCGGDIPTKDNGNVESGDIIENHTPLYPDEPQKDLPPVKVEDFANGKFTIATNGLPLFSDEVFMKDAINNEAVMNNLDDYLRATMKSLGIDSNDLQFTHKVIQGDFVAYTTIVDEYGDNITFKIAQSGKNGKWQMSEAFQGEIMTMYFNGVIAKPELLDGIAMPDAAKLYASSTQTNTSYDEQYVSYIYNMTYGEAKQFLDKHNIAYEERQEEIHEEGKPSDPTKKQNIIEAEVIKDLKGTEYSYWENDEYFEISISTSPMYNWRAPKDNEVTLDYLQNNILNSTEVPAKIAYCKMTKAQENKLRAAVVPATLEVDRDTGLTVIKFDDDKFYAQDGTGAWAAKSCKIVDGKTQETIREKGANLHPDFDIYRYNEFFWTNSSVEMTSIRNNYTMTTHIAKFDCISSSFTLADFKALFADVIQDGKFHSNENNADYNVTFECPSDGKANRVTVTCQKIEKTE